MNLARDWSNDDLDTSGLLAVSAGLALRRAKAARKAAIDSSRAFYGRRPHQSRDFCAGYEAIIRDYFGHDGQDPVYSETTFERRFRVPREVFTEIYEGIKTEPFWQQRVNATGQLQAHPLQKLVGAFRVLAYGESGDRTDEYVRLSGSTIDIATRKLVEHLVDRYEATYLRRPTTSELQAILDRNEARGMPGCMGSVDCSHWQWVNCPTALAGQYQNRKGERTIVMETVCDEDLYIWHFYIGCPGSMNDLNVLYTSPLYHSITSGQWPPSCHPYKINGRTRRLLYYLADGIYPSYPFLVRPISSPQTEQQRVFNRLQEALRKDVERLYAVLTGKFKVLLHPCRYGTVSQMIMTGKAVAILHNMAISRRRQSFVGHIRRGMSSTQRESTDVDPHPDTERMEKGTSDNRECGGDGTRSRELAGTRRVWGDAALPLDCPSMPTTFTEQQAVDANRYAMMAQAEATDKEQHAALLEDLTAHVWKERGSYLEPYL